MKIKFGKNVLSENSKCIIVAEISANHNRNLKRMKKLIFCAKQSGADAVKFQSYLPESLTINSNKKDFRIRSDVDETWKKYKNLFNLYKKGATPHHWYNEIFSYAKKIKIDLFSSPFDLEHVDLLEKHNCFAYKIGSPEINHYPLLEKVASTGKPIILSTGVAKISEIKTAISLIKNNGNKKIIILKCDSSYPAKFLNTNFSGIKKLKSRFKCLVGYSDHVDTHDSALLSVCFGSKMIERHFNLNDSVKTLDSFFSSKENDFSNLVKKVRYLERNLNYKEKYLLSANSILNRKAMRSIYISKNVKKNDVISISNIRVVRPAHSLNPMYYKKILGKRFKNNLSKGSRINLKDIK